RLQVASMRQTDYPPHALRNFSAAIAIGATLWAHIAQAQEPLDKDHAEKMARGLALFKKDVRSVLVAKCLKCHGGETIESEFDLTDRDRLLRGGASGKVAEPGRANAGKLHARLTHTKEPGMPLKGEKLADETIARIVEWIDLGAPYDAPLTAE